MQTLVVAKVLLVNEDNKLLLLQRSQSDMLRPLQWDIPGGHTDTEESADEAASRETLEEAGIAVDPKHLQLIYGLTQIPKPELSVTWIFYIGRTTEHDVVLSSEHIAFQWVTVAQAIEMLEYERQKHVLQYVQEHNLLETA